MVESSSKDKKNAEHTQKDTLFAKVSFYLALGFWIPLFNIGLGLTSIFIAINALKKMNEDSKNYGGFGYALTAIILSVTAIILTLIGLIIYLNSSTICGTQVCQAYFQNATGK